ncbi:4'-phosphopantetheinyl transferase superfamily protein, partial [Streptomyces sp. NPDC049577]|uniref:4'-phosphopantetheinyl transferase family protein n=1 Tax=Streptomyces sp. NPDC049577 TaxID=3155153 RepID=UPI00341CC5CC
PVRPGPHGEPRLAGHPDVGISVSHDGDTVAAAVAPGRRVGVDVQQPPSGPHERLVRRCLRERAEQLAALPPDGRAEEFAWVWTVQEACVKAAGTGLAGQPWAIDVPLGHRRGRWDDYAWVSLRDTSTTPLSCAFTDLEQSCPSAR